MKSVDELASEAARKAIDPEHSNPAQLSKPLFSGEHFEALKAVYLQGYKACFNGFAEEVAASTKSDQALSTAESI